MATKHIDPRVHPKIRRVLSAGPKGTDIFITLGTSGEEAKTRLLIDA
jgi:hypothetical protein